MATVSDHQRRGGKRGKASGWSPGAARRNVAFLRSVDETQLTGHGLACTLTLRTCPPSPEEWSRRLRAWIERQSRRSLIRIHWVMEMQRRCVPHLHAAVWFGDHDQRIATPKRAAAVAAASASLHRSMPMDDAQMVTHAAMLVADWCEVFADFEPGPRGQQVRPIEGPIGWFVYMSKHCGRTGKHYQRQRESLPEAWESSPRVWGHRGDFTIVEPARVDLSSSQFYRFRRLVKRWRVSQARRGFESGWPADQLPGFRRMTRELGKPTIRQQLRHLQFCRSMLRCTDRKLSEVRGVSEWIEEDVTQLLMRAL